MFSKYAGDKALSILKWQSTLYYNQTIDMISKWYNEYYNSKSKKDMYNFTLSQINEYENYALESKKTWCN